MRIGSNSRYTVEVTDVNKLEELLNADPACPMGIIENVETREGYYEVSLHCYSLPEDLEQHSWVLQVVKPMDIKPLW